MIMTPFSPCFRHSSHWPPTASWQLSRVKEAKNVASFQRPLLFLPQLSGGQLGSRLSRMPENGYVTNRCTFASEMNGKCWVDGTISGLCSSGASLVSIQDPQEALFIQQNLEVLHDVQKFFWIGLYKSHEGELKLHLVTKSFSGIYKRVRRAWVMHLWWALHIPSPFLFQASGCGSITVSWIIPTGKRGCQSQKCVWRWILTTDNGAQTAAADIGLTSAKHPKVSLIACYVTLAGPVCCLH